MRRLLEVQGQKLSENKRLAAQHKPHVNGKLSANLIRPRKARCSRFRNMTQMWIHRIAVRFTRFTASWGGLLAASHTRVGP
jgi:hypothetical protein